MFNTLQYAKKLEQVGIPRDQAEAHVQIIAEIIEGDVATKQDIISLKSSLEQDIKSLEDKLDNSVERIDHKMIQLESRLVLKLGTIVTIVIGTATAVIKLL